MKALYYLSLISFFFSSYSYAQNISGQLTTAENEPMNFALVYLYQADGALINGGFPDKNGQFKYEDLAQGYYKIAIDGGVGFKSYEFDSLLVSDSISVNLGSLKIEYAEGVVIQAKKVKPVLEIDVDKTILNVADNSLSTFPSTAQVLALAPEVSVQNGAISVLGKGNIRILINGKRTNLKLENIQPNTILAIEIISNPSAKYDADVDAVINILLKKGTLEGVQASVYSKYTQGIYPRTDLGASINYNKNKFSANLNAGYDYNKIRSVTKGQRAFEVSLPYYYSNTYLQQDQCANNFYVNADLSWNFGPQHQLTLSGEYSTNNAPAEQNVNNQSDYFGGDPTVSLSTADSFLQNQTHTQSQSNNYQAQLNYHNQFSEHWGMTAAINYMQLQPLSFNQYNFDFINQLDPGQSFNFSYQLADTSRAKLLISQLDFDWNKNAHSISFGAKHSYINSYYSLFFKNNDINFTGEDNQFEYDQSIYASYISWKSSWKRWQWSLGMRAEHSDLAGADRLGLASQQKRFDLFPSASVLWFKSNKHIFRFAYSKSIQRTGFFDRSPYRYYTGLYTQFLGNPNLRPQITHSGSLSYILNGQFMFTLFQNEMIDYINQISEREGSLERFQNINFQNSTFGLSIGGQLPLKKYGQLSVKVSPTGIYSRGMAQGENFKTLSFNTNCYLMHSFSLWNWIQVDIVANYSSPMAIAIYERKHLFYMDINLRKRFLQDKLSVSLYLADIFGTNVERNSVDFYQQKMQVKHYRDVQTLTLSLQYNFNYGRERDIFSVETMDENTLERVIK
ncbi:outer membrane beta-barrel protein [Saprospira grandis]|uniref:outer membrane beta-barrel protein n=1 Tax=Saprospira grandis TaxID=1008 RepID=UPI0022DE3879|nr:outer membrane beta-barrel protein [Saprospira grandis]WBM75942.1 TonB-dependent receptor [Saprospira grandis]